jgi:mitogen-activated protein kinase kinase
MSEEGGLKTKTLKRKNLKGLKLGESTSKAAPKEVIPDDEDALSNQLDTLEIGVEFKLDLRAEDLLVIHELGAGNGGTVSKVMHQTLKTVMARKVWFTRTL